MADAWRRRLGSMKLPQHFLGADYEEVKEDFLHCLTRPDHKPCAQVFFCLAVKPPR